MANNITLTSDAYNGRTFVFTVSQSGTSTTVNWTFEVTKMSAGNGTLATISDIDCTINGHSVYSHAKAYWNDYGSQGNTFPVYYGSTSGSYDIGSYGTFNVVLKGRPGYYDSPTTKSGTITLTQPAPTVNTITTTSIPSFIAGYDNQSFSLKTTPSGGSGYTYKWYRGATVIGTSQTLSGTLTHDTCDNTEVYCLVVDSTGGSATTNRCQFRVGTSSSQIQVSTHQIQPVKIYNGSSTLNGIPFIKTSDSLMYCSWTITRENTNVAGLAVAGKAVVG